MDSLTHLLMGHAMGALASNLSPTAGAAVYWAALIGNSLPDIDVPVSLMLRKGISLHRTYTHTIPGNMVLSAGAALLLQRFFPGTGFALLFGWTLLGTLVHVAVDCLNLFGAKPFWPLNGRSIELGVLHILDPILLIILGIPTLGAALGMASSQMVALGFVLIWPYILYRLQTARRLLFRLKREGSGRARIVPWYTSWRYIFETDGAIEYGRWHRGMRVAMETFVKHDDPRIAASKADPRVGHFLRQAEYPVAMVHEDAVIWIDAVRRLRADFEPLRVKL